jgi:hypothetical protein
MLIFQGDFQDRFHFLLGILYEVSATQSAFTSLVIFCRWMRVSSTGNE